MQATTKKYPKRSAGKLVFYTAITCLCLSVVAFSATGNKKFEQFLLMSCSSAKKGVDSLGLPTGKWRCQPRQIHAGFTISEPFENTNKSRFWYNKPNNQWLIWGYSNEPEADFVINVIWKETPDQYTGNLRQPLRKMKRFKQGRVTVSSKYQSIGVHQGLFEVLPFVYRDQTMVKKCLGFTNRQRDNRVLVRGWMCAEPRSTPTISKLECLLSSLTIDGILKQDHSSNWCSVSELLRQS